MAATLVLLAGAMAALPGGARAEVLVSNFGQADLTTPSKLDFDRAQAFTTGDSAQGYTLTSVDVEFDRVNDASAVYVVGIWSSDEEVDDTADSDSLDEPHASLGALSCTLTASASDSTVECTTTGIALDAETTYVFVIDSSGDADNAIDNTSSNLEDSGALSGWSIHDNGLTRSRDETGSWNTYANARKIRINGTVTNAAPTVANALEDQKAVPGTAFTYQFAEDAFTDADSDSLTYSAVESGETDLPTWLDFVPASRTFSGTPAASDVGAYSVTVTADDGKGGTASDEFEIVVNTLPTAAAGEVTTDEDRDYAFKADDFNFADDDTGDTLAAVRIASLPTGGTGILRLDGAAVVADQLVSRRDIDFGVFRYTPPMNASGNDYATFTFKVSDGDDDSASAYAMTVDVTAVNDAPVVVNEIPDQGATVLSPFSFVIPANTFSDAESSPLQYKATKEDGMDLPGWLSFNATSRTFSGTPQSGDAGTVSVKVTAGDGPLATETTLTAEDSFDITVRTSSSTAPAKVTGVTVTQLSGRLQVDWTAVTGADGYRVEWKSGTQSYGSSRRHEASGGSTTRHTFNTQGGTTEYTVRVSAFKNNATGPPTYGPYSDEATGSPTRVTPSLFGVLAYYNPARLPPNSGEEITGGVEFRVNYPGVRPVGIGTDDITVTCGTGCTATVRWARRISGNSSYNAVYLVDIAPASSGNEIIVTINEDAIAQGNTARTYGDSASGIFRTATPFTCAMATDAREPVTGAFTLNVTCSENMLTEVGGEPLPGGAWPAWTSVVAGLPTGRRFPLEVRNGAVTFVATISDTLVAEQTVTVTPSSNIERTLTVTMPAGSLASRASGSNKAQSNNRSVFRIRVDTKTPTLTAAAADRTSLVLTFSEDLAAASALASTSFTVKRTPQGGSEEEVAISGTPSISGATVTLTLSDAILATDTGVKVSYERPGSGSGNRLEDEAGNDVASFTDEAVEVRTADDAPGVTSIQRQTPSTSPTNANSLTWRVTFDENVKDVDAADFAASGTTATLAVSEVTASTVYDVTASGGDLATLDATVTLSFAAGQDIKDLADNALTDTAPTGTNEPDYVVDNTAPGVTSIRRQTPSTSPTNADSLTWRVTFDENVKDVDTADFAVSGTTATLTVSEVTASTVYDVTVSGGDLATLDATVTLSFAAGQDVKDAAGNALSDTAPTGTNEPDYVVDNTAPTLSSAAAAGTSLVLTFSEDLAEASALAGTSFTVERTPQGGAEEEVAVSGTPSISGAAVTLTLATAIVATDTDVKVSYERPGTGSGNRIADEAGNEVASLADEAVTLDGAPEITGTARVGEILTAGIGTIADADGLPSTFPDDYGFQWIRVDGTEADIAGADSRTYTLKTADEGKTVKVRVSFTDGGGNAETRTSDAYPGSGTVEAADDGAPVVTSIRRQVPSTSPTGEDSLTWRVTFDENVKDVDAADFAVSGTTATLAVSEVTASTVYDVTVSGGDLATLDATVTLSFAAGQDIKDLAGNALSDTSPTGTNEPDYVVDNTAPTLAAAAAAGTSLVMTFSEDLAAASALANTAFTVKRTPRGGSEEQVNLSGTPAISNAMVKLTLAAAVDSTDTDVKVSYERPGSGSGNRLEDKAGNDVASFADEAVSTSPVQAITVSPEPPGAGRVGELRCTKAALDALPDDAVHGRGATLTFTLTFDRDVTVNADPDSGALPSLALDVFGRERHAGYTGPAGSPTRSMTFDWSVERGDYDPDGIEVRRIILDGATIRDSQGIDLDLATQGIPATRFEAHRVRGGYFAVSLEAGDGPAREGEPFTVRVVRDGGFGERALAIGSTTDTAVNGDGKPTVRSVAIDLAPEGATQTGGEVADGRSGTWHATPQADGKADAARTLTFRLLHAETGCTGVTSPVAWYDIGSPAQATVAVTDAGITATGDAPGLSVGPARAAERDAGRLPMTFRVCLWTGSLCPGAGRSPAFEAYGGVSHEVRVDYATRDGTATEGADYVATSGTLVFAPGETVKMVDVELLPDDHDEGKETVWLELSSPVGAVIERGRNFGEIYNQGPIPRKWIARFGRTVAEQGVDAVRDRLAANRTPGFRGRIAGRALPAGAGAGTKGVMTGSDVTEAAHDVTVTGATETAGAGTGTGTGDGSRALPEFTEEERLAFVALLALEGGDDAQETLPDSRTLTADEILLGTGFELARETDFGLSFGLWGRAAKSVFSGRDGDLALDGEATTVMFGTDWERRDALFGLMLFRNRGEGGYRSPGDSGKVEALLAGLVPYAGRRVGDGLSLWGAAGTGRGEMTLTPAGRDPIAAGLGWSMAAAGAEGAPVVVDALGGAMLGWRADALWTRTASEAVAGLAAASGRTSRLRLGLETAWQGALVSGVVLTPRLEAGVRHDGGDAETGFGLEVGGGVRLEVPVRGLSASLDGRALALHEDGDFEDWGLALTLEWDPRPDTRLGPSVLATRGYGGESTGGVAALLDPETVPVPGDAGGGAGSLDLEVAWGTDLSSWRHGMTGSAYGRVSGSPDARDLRFGWRIEPDVGLDIGLNRDFWLEPGPDSGTRVGADLRWENERTGTRTSTGVVLIANEGGGIETGLDLTWEW